MSITQAQIDFEKNWAQRYVEAVSSVNFDDWKAFLKESSVVTRSGQPPAVGLSAIHGMHTTLMSFAKKWEVSNVVPTVDGENQRILITFHSVGYLNADPEQKPLHFSSVIIIEKSIGTGEEKMDSEEGICDPSPSLAKLAELGINPADIVKPSA